MRGIEELVIMPAVTVPSAVADPPSQPPRGIDVAEERESPTPSPPWHDHYRHHHHTKESDHFRRLEDRIDHLHDQILATQRLVQELARLFDPERPPLQRSPPRLTVRTLSSKALLNGHRPVSFVASPMGSGPSSSLPLAAAFLSTMPPTASSPKTLTAIALSNDRAHDEVKPSETRDAVSDLATRPAAHAEYLVASQTRKLSATNPVSLLPAKRESKPLVAVAVAHAMTFIAEIVSATSTNKMPTNADPHGPPTTANESGPIRGRRFSISSLNADAPHLHAHPPPRRVDRVAKWTRNLFRPSLEAVVAPEEIEHARREYASLHRFSIRHDSAQRMVWDIVVMLMILVDIVVTPLSLGFRLFPHGMTAYNIVGNLIFATDFAVHLLSSYTTPRGVLVSHPRRTMSHYLTSPWALADFLSWFPFEVFVASEQGRFFGVAKVIRLAKVSQLARRLHSARKVGVFRFLRLLVIVFIVSHCLSCYWNWVAVDWRRAEDGYQDMTLGEQYAHCWSLVIGSLNASPPAMHSTTEEVSVAIFMLIGNVLQATVFGSVAVLIQSFDEDEVAYNKKLISTYERCRFLDIPETLARRIQGYYENLYRETRSVDPDADAFINELSPALICEVKFQLYRDMIKQIPFLSATHINPVVIEMLILHLRTVIYMQDDVLIRKGEVGDWMGFIGSKGSVGVLDPKSEFRKIIRILRKGDYFGEMALLQRAKRSTTAIALTWVQIHVLCRNDLDDVKDQYPEQAEILEHEITKYMQTKVKYK